MAVESLKYLTIKSVKKCVHPVDNTKLASYKIALKIFQQRNVLLFYQIMNTIR